MLGSVIHVGCVDGSALGYILGISLGSLLAAPLRVMLGISVGLPLGSLLGAPDDIMLGISFGLPLGSLLGISLGFLMGVILIMSNKVLLCHKVIFILELASCMVAPHIIMNVDKIHI